MAKSKKEQPLYYKQIEETLYGYNELVTSAGLLEAELDIDALRAVDYDKDGQGASAGWDSTALIALKKLESPIAKELYEIRKEIYKIELIGDFLTEQQLSVIKAKYFSVEPQRVADLLDKLGLNKETYYRVKDQAINRIARVWGMSTLPGLKAE